MCGKGCGFCFVFLVPSLALTHSPHVLLLLLVAFNSFMYLHVHRLRHGYSLLEEKREISSLVFTWPWGNYNGYEGKKGEISRLVSVWTLENPFMPH